MVTVVNERLETIMQELVQKLTEESFQQITATTPKGRGSYAPHMNPSRRQPQNYKKNLQKLQSFAKRTRSQAMVTASNTPPPKTPKQKLSYRDILKISQSPLSEREEMKQAILSKNSTSVPIYQSPRQMAQPQLKTPPSTDLTIQSNQTMTTSSTPQNDISEILLKLQDMEQRSITDNQQFCQAFVSMGNSINNMQTTLTDHNKIIQALCQNTLDSSGQPLFSPNTIQKLNLPPISPNIKLLQSPLPPKTQEPQDLQTQSISTLTDSSHSIINLKNELDNEKNTHPFQTYKHDETNTQSIDGNDKNTPINSSDSPRDVHMSTTEEDQRPLGEDGHRETAPPGGGKNP